MAIMAIHVDPPRLPMTTRPSGRAADQLRNVRFTRHYKLFSLKLLEFTHDKYLGTEKPKNFASRVRIQRPATGEDREVVIYMNNPLRYGGETYYQASFDPDNDKRANKVTILQVFRNPSWIAPYFACSVMALGMAIQFLMHLAGFAGKLVKA